MNTPTPPKYLSDAISEVTGRVIRLESTQFSFVLRYRPAGSFVPTRMWLALTMSRINPECPDSETPNESIAADVVLRQEPDEEEDEDEEEDHREEEDDDGNNDEGYSE